MGILMLAAACGTELKLQTEGADEEQALVKMVEIFNNGFGEEI
jgi:phosphotransferase system HPr-like phosphotransfer protein